MLESIRRRAGAYGVGALRAARSGTYRAFERTLGSVGFATTRLTTPDTLRGLLADLHPVTTDLPLVRVGPPGDGGYLVPDDLDGIVACFSPGVGPVSDFELECVGRGMDVFMADASVSGPAVAHERFHFVPKFLGVAEDDSTLTMDRWVQDSLGDRTGDLLLQMDIEGAEWPVLPTISDELLARFRIIVIEIHRIHDLFVLPAFQLMAPVLRRLAATHVCVHVHPNNCCGSVTREGVELPRLAEFTFVRRDRVTVTGHARQFPHPLDADNTGNPPLVLPPGMWRA